MSGLAALLAGHRPPDAYRWEAGLTADDVRASVEVAGWRLVHVEPWTAATRRDALVALGVALGLPWGVAAVGAEQPGVNLDALWDGLRDLPGPTLVLWDGWALLALEDPTGLAALLRVLRTRAVEAGDLAVLLHGDGPDLDPALGITLLA